MKPREGHLQVGRTARYWTLGEAGAGEVWYVLHGYRQLAARFIRRFADVAGPDRLVVAPEALHRFYLGDERGRHGPRSPVGASWMTREDRLHEIADYVAYLDGLHRHAGPDGAEEVTVLGFSQGVATAARWVVLGAVRPRRLICWGDTLPPDLDMERAARSLEGVELVLVRGSDDAAVEAARAEEERSRLADAGVAYRVVTYEGGHDIDAAALRALAGA